MGWRIVAFIISLGISIYSMSQRPKTPGLMAQEFTAPTASEGGVIPILFGTRDIVGPNVVWYGDIGIEEIKSSG